MSVHSTPLFVVPSVPHAFVVCSVLPLATFRKHVKAHMHMQHSQAHQCNNTCTHALFVHVHAQAQHMQCERATCADTTVQRHTTHAHVHAQSHAHAHAYTYAHAPATCTSTSMQQHTRMHMQHAHMHPAHDTCTYAHAQPFRYQRVSSHTSVQHGLDS